MEVLQDVYKRQAIGRKKSSVCEDDSALMQKFFTKQSFVDVLPIKPDRQIHIRRFPVLRHGDVYKRQILMRVDEGSRVISIERVDREEEEPETPVEE